MDTGTDFTSQEWIRIAKLVIKVVVALGGVGAAIALLRRIPGEMLRLLGLGAVFVGSVYVLIPSAIEIVEGPREPVGQVSAQAPTKHRAPDMEMLFDAADPKAAEEASESLEARLRASGIPVDRVDVDENGRVRVVLAPGGSRDAVLEQVGAVGLIEGYALDAVFPPAVPPVAGWEQARALYGRPVPPGTPALPGFNATLASGVFSVQKAPAAGDVIVTIDGIVRAAAVRTDTGFQLEPLHDAASPLATHVWEAARALVEAGRLPTALTPFDPKSGPALEADDGAEAHVSAVPDWVWSVLPPYKISLGLDLQGGIDMTLTVELEEAVLGQVARDASVLADLAKTDALAVTSAHRDIVDPVLHIIGPVPLADLQSWVAKKFPRYEYESTSSAAEGTDHAFRLSEAEQRAVGDSATEQVLETLRKRIDATGVKEPVIVKKGVGRIGVQLPGKVDLQAAIDAIGTTAVLEFHLVDEAFDDLKLDIMLTAAREALPADQYEDDRVLNRWLHDAGHLDAKHYILWEYADVGADHVRTYPLPLMTDIILTGGDISQAGVNWDQNNQPYVSMEFKSRGASVFCTVTGENVNKRFAVVLDDEIRSAPKINERICGGGARIEMGGADAPLDEANTLALVLRTGSLTAPVSVGQVTTVGASLGRDAIVDGTISMVIGTMLVFIYMAMWYRVSGLVANATLLLNVLLVLAFLALFGATLTLPGICGIALTVGIAVDANIIVYERIREELRLGVNARKAVDAGFQHAYSAIIDAHVTQAIAGVVLYSYGAGPIKGFAVAMIIGIATTLFTSLIASRILMEVLTRNSTNRLSI